MLPVLAALTFALGALLMVAARQRPVPARAIADRNGRRRD